MSRRLLNLRAQGPPGNAQGPLGEAQGPSKRARGQLSNAQSPQGPPGKAHSPLKKAQGPPSKAHGPPSKAQAQGPLGQAQGPSKRARGQLSNAQSPQGPPGKAHGPLKKAQGPLREVSRSGSLPDPVGRYSAPLFKGFVRYLHWYMSRHFHAVLISRQGLPRVPHGRPLIIYSNHPSWWDPLLFVLLGEALFPGRRGYGPMEAVSLKRYAILERLGAFAIDLESARGGVAFLIQARRILANHGSILWLTAEGAFTDVRQRPVKIRQGLGHLVRMVTDAVVMPLAVEYPFWNESRPEALCRFGDPIEVGQAGAEPRTAAEWNDFFECALTRTMEQLSQESVQRSREHFRFVLQGRSGVGGIYDGWRRLRAWSRGKHFDASHEQQE